MQWDLGALGLVVLAAVSLGFGIVARLVLGTGTPRWAWLVATAAYFVLGLVISEVWFGWATQEELQPNIDGLSFDEVFLGVFPALVVVLLVRYAVRRRRRPPTGAALPR